MFALVAATFVASIGKQVVLHMRRDVDQLFWEYLRLLCCMFRDTHEARFSAAEQKYDQRERHGT